MNYTKNSYNKYYTNGYTNSYTNKPCKKYEKSINPFMNSSNSSRNSSRISLSNQYINLSRESIRYKWERMYKDYNTWIRENNKNIYLQKDLANPNPVRRPIRPFNVSFIPFAEISRAGNLASSDNISDRMKYGSGNMNNKNNRNNIERTSKMSFINSPLNESCEDVSSILEKIIKINQECERDIRKRMEEDIKKCEMERVEFYNQEYDEMIIKKINGLKDLIELGNMYNVEDDKKYNINLKLMSELKVPLIELDNMIGMAKLKDSVVDLIMYYLQDFEMNNRNMLHTVIEGPPGCGKTEVSKILAKIFAKMGVIKSDYLKIVKRSDLIGKYLGSTAVQTQAVIDDVKEKGGVLFIDEAYSLGNEEKRDHFSKECIDTINQNLTEEKCNFICIIAGYKEDLNKSFFAYNQGLERRFPFRFEIEAYESKDLREIYLKFVREDNWRVRSEEEDVSLEFFVKNRKYFRYNGGDMETLFHFTKISHSRRVFCLPKKDRKVIIREDLENALGKFLSNDEVKNRDANVSYQSLYT
jgi:hypothetical protein